MNLTINQSYGNKKEENMGLLAAGAVQKKQEGKEASPCKKNIFAGDTDFAVTDPIELRRRQARKQAMKIVGDAWANERKVEQSVNDRRAHYEQKSMERNAANQELNEINKQKAELKEQFHIGDDCGEQQDLELLEKRQDYNNHVSMTPPTPEEMKRLAEIDKKPLTEYQKRALSLNNYAGQYKLTIYEATKQMRDDVADLRSIALERLKTHPMVDAEKTAESILDAANKDIIGMLADDARDVIDDKADEAKEEAEKKAEEKEEEEEYLDELAEKKAIQEALIEQTKEAVEEAKAKQKENDAPQVEIDDIMEVTTSSGISKEVNDSLEEVKNSMKLLEADLKGIQVDEQV